MREGAPPLVASTPASPVVDDERSAAVTARVQRVALPPEAAAQSSHALVATTQRRLRTLEAAVEPRAVGIAIAVAVHAAMLLAAWHVAQTRTPAQRLAPIVVELLTPSRVERQPPPPPAIRRPVPKPLAQPTPRVEPPAQVDLPLEPPPVATVTLPPPTPEPPPIAAIAAPPEPPAPPRPVVTPPRFDADYLRNPAPEYPPMARRHGEQGRVLLRVLVGASGDPREIAVKTSSGSERLDRAAQESVRRWRFVPARIGIVAVDAWVIVPIVFALTR